MNEPISSKTKHSDQFEDALKGLSSKMNATLPPRRLRARLYVAASLRRTLAQEPPTARRILSLSLAALALAAVLLFVIRIAVYRFEEVVPEKQHRVESAKNLNLQGRSELVQPPSNEKKTLSKQVTPREPSKRPTQRSSFASVTVALPYSNSDVSSQPSSTIRTSMKSSDLRTLGLDVPDDGVHSEIIALLTLGSDGLPRSITVPIPYKSVQEDQ